jgi:hypothetical protein
MKAFVLSPDMAKQQLTSIMHFFQIGQFDILVALNQGYPEPLPPMKEVTNIINFEIPESYMSYKTSGTQIDSELGSIITLFTPQEEKKDGMLG